MLFYFGDTTLIDKRANSVNYIFCRQIISLRYFCFAYWFFSVLCLNEGMTFLTQLHTGKRMYLVVDTIVIRPPAPDQLTICGIYNLVYCQRRYIPFRSLTLCL